jgi:GTP-binding protein Era
VIEGQPCESGEHRSGFVAIVGRPNVGKSTLLNAIVGRKVAAVTPKPQTTRTRILGIKSLAHAQMLFLDTPGLHAAQGMLNERMVEAARRAANEADVVVALVDASAGTTPADRTVLEVARQTGKPVCIVVTKIDLVARRVLLPLIDEIGRLFPDRPVIPVSAVTGDNLDRLLDVVAGELPPGPAYYPEDEITDQSVRAIVAEIVREKVMLETQQEIPYSTAVTVDEFTEKPEKGLVVIKATIHVARESQKPIVIGRGGSRIKAIGQAARQEIEGLVGGKVFLELFVRVQENWTSNLQRLKDFGL